MEPTATGVRPILKTATKTGTRTRFLADSASKYKSYSQSFHYTSYSSSSSSGSISRRAGSTSRSTSASSFGSSVFSASSPSSSTDASSLPSSQSSTASSSRERKRSDEIFLTPGDRRVTFSQFTKSSRKPKSKKALAESRKMTSGFVFSTGGEVEKRKQVRKKQELRVMQKLYLASRKRTLGWKDLLFEQFAILKDVSAWTQRCVDFFKASPVVALVRKALKQQYRRHQKKQQQQEQRHRRSRRSARPRPLRLGTWSAFDQADHEYMKRLALQPQKLKPQQQASSESASSSLSLEMHRPLRIQSDDPVPDLTPVKQGSFSSLLRREGIPVDEDAKSAVMDDPRGVGRVPAIRLKVSPTAA